MLYVPTDLLHRLRMHGQDHLLFGWDTLTRDERTSFVLQLSGLDLAELEALYLRRNEPHTILPPRDRIAPLPVESADSIDPEAIERGEEALRSGKVAALVVAGGQGSRLGTDAPKGTFPVGPVSGATLFQIHARKIVAIGKRYGRPVPFLVMTSPATHEATEQYFDSENYFGLAREDVLFFRQGTMPSLDIATGKILLEKPGTLFLGPNGHGGTLTALADVGLLDDLRARGIEQLFYFQVDNPLVKIADPAFLGRHIVTGSEASSKILRKTEPKERVGVLALIEGRCGIIEYSDLPDAMAEERDSSGELLFRAGNPAIHIFSLDFLDRVTRGAGRLSYHVARKKVPHFDPARKDYLQPTSENALKFELFIFDALPAADRWYAVETDRDEEFAPLKNATGADSPETVRNALARRAANWLERAGIPVPRHPSGELIHPVEICPTRALDRQECHAFQGLTITQPTCID